MTPKCNASRLRGVSLTPGSVRHTFRRPAVPARFSLFGYARRRLARVFRTGNRQTEHRREYR